MRKIVHCNIILAALALSLSACATMKEKQSSAQPPDWHSLALAAGQVADIDLLSDLAVAFPNSSSVRLRLLNAHLEAGNLDEAFAILDWLHNHGYEFSSAAREQLPAMFDEERGQQLRARFATQIAPLSASEIVASLPAEAHLPESLLVSEEGGFLVTDIVRRGIWRYDGDTWEFQAGEDFGNISGIVQTAAQGSWVASANLGMLQEDAAIFRGLLDPAGSEERIAAPESVNLSDLAIAADGTLFASDPLAGGVYRLRPGNAGFDVLLEPGTLRSPQGIAPNADGTRLYVSDYRYGLAIVDIATGKVSRLAADIPVLLDGIDALWLHDGELIGVQNGVNPMRIVALGLSADGNRITRARDLERGHPDWTEPLGGDIHEGALYYIGNGSWDLFEAGGMLREGAELRITHIRRVELAENPTD